MVHSSSSSKSAGERLGATQRMRESIPSLLNPAVRYDEERIRQATAALQNYGTYYRPLLDRADETEDLAEKRSLLYRALLRLQRQAFYLAATHGLEDRELVPYWETYRAMYKDGEERLTALDFEPAGVVGEAPVEVPESERDYVELKMEDQDESVLPVRRRS